MATDTSKKPGPSQDRIGRVKILEELDGFIQTSETQLNDILSQIGWTRDSLQEECFVHCSHDPHHLMPESSLSKHLPLCQWLKEGYSREDYSMLQERVHIAKSPYNSMPEITFWHKVQQLSKKTKKFTKMNETNSSAFFYHNTNSVFSMTMDQETQNNILSQANGCRTVKPIPRTAEKACTGFSQKEKLAIYDYVVAQGQRSRASSSSSKLISEVGEDLDSSGGTKKGKDTFGTKTMSRLEVLKQMRDYKRRRQSYRAKNVHITKRSQTDIMREIIKNQMDELEAEQQSSHLMREASNELPLNRDLDQVNESSPRNNEEEVSRLVGRYREESKRKQKKNMDENQRDNRSVLFSEFSHGPTRYQEMEEIDRYGGRERRENSGDRDYEREIRRELGADRGGSFLNAGKYEEMAQSTGNGTRTRSTSPAERSPKSQYSSKYKKHRHHKKHKTRD